MTYIASIVEAETNAFAIPIDAILLISANLLLIENCCFGRYITFSQFLLLSNSSFLYYHI